MRILVLAKWSLIGALVGLTFAGVAQGERRTGYLAPDAFDILAVLPRAPVQDDPRYEADRKMFLQTRALVGSARWDMAINDVKTSSADMMRDFSCAAGIELTPAGALHLAALIGKASIDTGFETNLAKNYYKRLRPFQIDKGQICQPASEVANTFDYPSGHTTLGWTWAAILAELIPDRATAILARGRAFGESRIVCGVHNASAVEAGRLSATMTVSVIRGMPSYQADLEAARAELNKLRQSGGAPKQEECTAESKLVQQDIFITAR